MPVQIQLDASVYDFRFEVHLVATAASGNGPISSQPIAFVECTQLQLLGGAVRSTSDASASPARKIVRQSLVSGTHEGTKVLITNLFLPARFETHEAGEIVGELVVHVSEVRQFFVFLIV